MIIAVIGGGDGCTAETYKLAHEVGAEIARRGHTVICGGMNGVMEAACKGAKSAGGNTIGILPGYDASSANRYVDYPIVTGMGYARNVIVVRSASVVIAVDGEFGTLSEIAHALGFRQKVVGLKTWALTRPDGKPDASLIIASDAAEAVEKALAAVKHPEKRRKSRDKD